MRFGRVFLGGRSCLGSGVAREARPGEEGRNREPSLLTELRRVGRGTNGREFPEGGLELWWREKNGERCLGERRNFRAAVGVGFV